MLLVLNLWFALSRLHRFISVLELLETVTLRAIQNSLVVINNQGYVVFIQILHRQQMFNQNGSLLKWFIWIVKTCALTPLTRWYHWLVQYSRWRRTIRRFEKLQLSFVLMPTHHLIFGNMCFRTIKLKINSIGMGTLKK